MASGYQKFMLILPRARYAQQEKSSLQSVKAIPGIAEQFLSEFKRLRASQAVQFTGPRESIEQDRLLRSPGTVG